MQSIFTNTFKRLAVLAATMLVATAAAALAIAAAPARAEFGIAAFDQQITSDAAGDLFTQAGGHPYAITTNIDLDSIPDPTNEGLPRPDESIKDIETDLPPGLVGDPDAVTQCTQEQFTPVQGLTSCPVSSQIGVAAIEIGFGTERGRFWVPLFNLVPPDNAPARFGFIFLAVPIMLDANVASGGDYSVTVASRNTIEALRIFGTTLTFWGVPADPSHDSDRCNIALSLFLPLCGEGNPGAPAGVPPSAFLRMPTLCTAPGVGLKTTLSVDSWEHPGMFVERSLFSHLPPGYPAEPSEWGAQQGTTDCGFVPFGPRISVQPTNQQADTPTGLNVDFALPQEGLRNPNAIGTSDVRKTVITLPAGVAISPSAAGGLGACSLADIGLGSADAPTCPDSSKIGTVEVDTPLLPTPLTGSVYLARQNENPFGSLVAFYLVAHGHGVMLKLAGRIDLDPVTGQLTATVDNSPQLPFDDLKVDFKGGPRAPLVNPHACGTYTTLAQLTPWSGTGTVETSSAFQITSGPEGRPCPTSTQQSFAPSFVAGTTNNQAGAFSPFALTLGRSDGEQQLGGITIKTPPGLLGTLSAVPLCGEPQAAQGTCGAASQIGSVTAAAGAGANPFYVTGGKVFLTGGYKGAPFGLSIAVPAVAGPFDLGTVVVRASIAVDPHTAELTIASDPLPTILDGIPLDLRVVNVSVDRPGFIFNPTDCDPLKLSGTLTGGLGGSEAFSSNFQVTNCGSLGFAPKFTVSTQGHTSRVGGASLDAKIVYPKGAQANIARVKVSLPKQLPSRLTTLQKACVAAVFDANPANCPAASLVGSATASTPVLPVKLSGPVYFVSNGGEAFPNLVVVLQGYGVTVDLVGDTFISKTGITSSTFKTVPDVPVESFELKLPQGPYSALAANGNLCRRKLTMPTQLVAQDGAEINQRTPVKVTGCPKAKKTTRKHKARR